MFSRVIELAVGMSLVWLLLAGFTSSLLEGVRLLFHRRQKTLFAAIGTLLDGTDRPGRDSLTAKLYREPEVRHEIPWRRRRRLDNQPPLRWYRRRGPDPARRLANYGPERLEPGTFAAAVENGKLNHEFPVGVYRQATMSEQDGFDRVALADWFTRGMAVVTVEYRRTSRVWLFAIGLLLAVGLQIDAIDIARHLWTDSSARSSLLEAPIGCPEAQPTSCTVSVDASASLPLGWNCSSAEDDPCDGFWTFVRGRSVGWLLTAVAVSLGAPFWFQIVRRLTMNQAR